MGYQEEDTMNNNKTPNFPSNSFVVRGSNQYYNDTSMS